MSNTTEIFRVTLPDPTPEHTRSQAYQAAVEFFIPCGVELSAKISLQTEILGMFLVTIRSEVNDNLDTSPAFRCLEMAVAQGIIKNFNFEYQGQGTVL